MSVAGGSFQLGATPTVLLVHGEFADGSSWTEVAAALQLAGIDVGVPANALRGLGADAAYLAHLAGCIDGPVLLVGHAYGGAVVTVAGALARNVVGVAYVAAYALDVGESCIDVAVRFPDNDLGPALQPATYPRAAAPLGVELYLKADAYAAVSGDLPAQAATQRPIAAGALEERAGAAAWRTLPSWYVVATGDRMLDPAAQRFMARRAIAETIELDAPHALVRSHADAIASLLAGAAQLTPTRSTTKMSVSSGPMTPPAPRLP